MQANLKMYGVLRINQDMVIDLGHNEIRVLIAKAAQALIGVEIDSRSVSALQIQLSKQPIRQIETDWDKMIRESGLQVNQVMDDDPLPDFPDITWGEYNQVCQDSVFTQALILSNPKTREKFGRDEMDSIKAAFKQKYGETKFFKLIGDRL